MSMRLPHNTRHRPAMDGPPSEPGGELARGWRVVLASAIGAGSGVTGLAFYAVGQFIRPLGHAFGWSRAAVSTGVLCLLLGTVLTAPLIGGLVDRIGVRRLALASMGGIALGFVALSRNGGSLLLFQLGWLLVSVLGCGTTPLIWTRAVGGWFDRRRGLALGLTLAGTGLSALLVPLLLSRLIAVAGWRTGFLALAAEILLLGLPCVWLWFGERGEQHPSEPAPQPERASWEWSPAEPDLSLRQAMRGTIFWRLLVGMLLVAGVVAGLIVHLTPLLMDRGASAISAGGWSSLLGVAVIVGRVGIGGLLDRSNAARVAGLFLMLPAIACLLLAADRGALAALLLIGLAAGAEVDLLAYLASRCFGLRHYGAIYGWLLSAFSLGGGIGPILAGRVHDATGSYRMALLAGAALCAAGALLIGSIRTGRPAPALAPPPVAPHW